MRDIERKEGERKKIRRRYENPWTSVRSLSRTQAAVNQNRATIQSPKAAAGTAARTQRDQHWVTHAASVGNNIIYVLLSKPAPARKTLATLKQAAYSDKFSPLERISALIACLLAVRISSRYIIKY